VTEETETTVDTSNSKQFHFSYKIRGQLSCLKACLQTLSDMGGGGS